jgi:ectoine hydroxylase-related dioxygenase (phytanoyl-CoA dioxygenase family)
MNQHDNTLSKLPPYFGEEHISIEAFEAIQAQTADIEDYPTAAVVEQNVLIYEGDTFRGALSDPVKEAALKAELCRALRDGPGVFVVKNAYPDTSVIDRSTAIFHEIVAEEKAAGLGQGDHFGENERIWNSIQKACLKDPELFIDYYGNPILAIACEAWLGPFYQISAQMNDVKPGSKAQSMHRDYHLGFQSRETVARFPAHIQVSSQYLTLQGAIAHTDMPLESGPTLLLPFSQQYEAGYLAYTRPEFQAYFDEHKVQLPFNKGDMVFFSPALFHGAGTNTTATDRIANLVQISSAFGRTMETIDNSAMVEAVYPLLLARVKAGRITERQLQDTIAAAADGYSFPTNLDSDPPLGGNAPETGQQLMQRALLEQWPLEQLQAAMVAYAKRREA